MELEGNFVSTTRKSIVAGIRVMFCLALPFVSAEVRKKLDVRSLISIHFGDAGFDGFKGKWFLIIENGCLIVSDVGSYNQGVFPFRDSRVVSHLGLKWNSPKQTCPGFRDLSYLTSAPFVQTADMLAVGAVVERLREVSPTTFLGVSEAMILNTDDPAKATQDELHDARHNPREKSELHDTRHTMRNLGDTLFPTFDVGVDRVVAAPLALPVSADGSEAVADPVVLPSADDGPLRKPAVLAPWLGPSCGCSPGRP